MDNVNEPPPSYETATRGFIISPITRNVRVVPPTIIKKPSTPRFDEIESMPNEPLLPSTSRAGQLNLGYQSCWPQEPHRPQRSPQSQQLRPQQRQRPENVIPQRPRRSRQLQQLRPQQRRRPENLIPYRKSPPERLQNYTQQNPTRGNKKIGFLIFITLFSLGFSIFLIVMFVKVSMQKASGIISP